MDRCLFQSDNIELEVIQFTTFGKDMIRQLNLHPDTFVQMAVQYAYYRIYRKYVPLSCCFNYTIQYNTIQYKTYNAPYVTKMLFARHIACCRTLTSAKLHRVMSGIMHCRVK